MDILYQNVKIYEAKWKCPNCNGYLEYSNSTGAGKHKHKCNKCGYTDIPEGDVRYPMLVFKNDITNKILKLDWN